MRHHYLSNSLEVFVNRKMGRLLEVAFSSRGMDGKSQIMKPVQFETVEEGVWFEPAMVLDIEEGQQLMDELWRAGLRPTEGTGSAGSLAATERHLSDMRTIVASKLNVELPKGR
jgi:hypothetical protein